MPRKAIPPHGYADPGAAEPADYAKRKVCAACGLLGKPGDQRHPVRARPLAEVLAAAGEARTRAPRRASAASQARTAAILAASQSRTAAILAAGRDRDAAILGERDR